MNQTVVKNDEYVIRIDLGSCVAVILCGIDDNRTAWFGVNHLFKSRVENNDVALEHIANLYNSMTDLNVKKICCLGLFGAGYREKSLARNVAQLNVLTILEALDLFGLTIEIFQTGYSQGIGVLKSDERDSFLIQHSTIGDRKSRIIEIPLIQLFR